MCPDPTVFSARASARVPSTSIVHENLYSRGQPRHQCLPFQVEACGRCQPVFGSHICSRTNVVRLVRPQGPWQMLLASTLRPWFVWPGKLSYAPLPQPSLLDPPSCSFDRLSILTIHSPLLLAPRTTPSFALFCGRGFKKKAGQTLSNLSGENGSGTKVLQTARDGRAVEVGPLRLLVVPSG